VEISSPVRSSSPAVRSWRPKRRQPVVLAEANRRGEDIQLRIADSSTAFAGSMRFVYLRALLFVGWMIWLAAYPRLRAIPECQVLTYSTEAQNS
jgi:hypothetical protein